MLMTFLVVAIVSAALIAGALWGIYGKLTTQTQGFVIALAGGALIVSLVTELIEPSLEQSNMWVGLGAVAAGAVVFSVIDYWIDEKWGADGGGGLLAAITLDGIPENLALGVALIGAKPIEVSRPMSSPRPAALPPVRWSPRWPPRSSPRPIRKTIIWPASRPRSAWCWRSVWANWAAAEKAPPFAAAGTIALDSKGAAH
mgnify:CR=1 FL=1